MAAVWKVGASSVYRLPSLCASFRLSMSASTEGVTLKRTPLYSLHRELGAKIVEFGGWEMPVQYSGILEEHRAVRERAGIFDVSHMGELEFEGPDALEQLQGLTPTTCPSSPTAAVTTPPS